MSFPKRLRRGKTFSCAICKKEFYRSPAQVQQGSTKTCSKTCLSIYFKGNNNPFWGKIHSNETKSAISQNRKNKAVGNSNALGYRHTTEARKMISDSSKKLWKNKRDFMLSRLPRGENNSSWMGVGKRRYRINFSPLQRRTLKKSHCEWCNSTENLQLDHIIPVSLNGTNDDFNAQTLCSKCNLWKLHHIERQMYISYQRTKGTIF